MKPVQGTRYKGLQGTQILALYLVPCTLYLVPDVLPPIGNLTSGLPFTLTMETP
jgi:hypothetical protein